MKKTTLLIAALLVISPFAFAAKKTTAKKVTAVEVDSAGVPECDKSRGAFEFKFKYAKSDEYRILSTVTEDILVNHRFDHSSKIVNRISVNVTDVEINKLKRASGHHEATFMTSESAFDDDGEEKFKWGKEYTSVFERDELGYYTIGDEYFMPVVRDVPIFPGKPVAPGDVWHAQGHEVHDLRTTFKVEKPFKVPFNCDYTYEGVYTDPETGDEFHVINADYTLYFETDLPAEAKKAQKQKKGQKMPIYPVNTMGHSNQVIYWNAEKGCIDHYNETFRIIIETSIGYLFEFVGSAEAEVTQMVRTNQELEAVQKTVEDLGIKNVSVSKGDKGLVITMEKIKFNPDSDVLLDSEKDKLNKIATILRQFPDNDILVTGHTALAGSEKKRQILSEDRAQSVANYLMKIGVKDKYHIFIQGKGATVPIADNSTEEGKSKNRRVEITILDK